MRNSESGPYDLESIQEQCEEAGLECEVTDDSTLTVFLSGDLEIRFINDVVTNRMGQTTIENDSMIEFGGMKGGHTHEHQFDFVDRNGHYVSMHYLDVIPGISSGEVLIAGHWKDGKLQDSWFVHREYNNEFDHMEEGDEIRVRRIFPARK
jgi:enamine deaminase RidA (YjgF/YER057c/UK114 family)